MALLDTSTEQITPRRRLRRPTNPYTKVVLSAVAGVLTVLLIFGVMNNKADATVVPDLRGMSYEAAAGVLREEGLIAEDVSFTPGTPAQAGKVIRTIPDVGTKIQTGARVNIVAGALPTPAPSVTPLVSPPSDEKGSGKDRKRARDRAAERRGDDVDD